MLISLNAEQAWPAQATHTDYTAIELGARQARDDLHAWSLGLVLGLVMIGLLSVTLTFAANHLKHGVGLRRCIYGGSLIYAACFVGLMLSWRSYAEQAQPSVSGPFTAPTNWLVFGMWMAPVVFTLIYVLGFSYWFEVADDDEVTKAES